MDTTKRDLIVYVAGPIMGSGSQIQNVRKAIDAATLLAETHKRILPFVPHLYSFWDFAKPRPRDFWLDLDKGWVDKSSGLVRLPGESPGSDQEVAWAEQRGIPVVRFEPTEYRDHNIIQTTNLVEQILLREQVARSETIASPSPNHRIVVYRNGVEVQTLRTWGHPHPLNVYSPVPLADGLHLYEDGRWRDLDTEEAALFAGTADLPPDAIKS